jgi:two-component system, chemotaxis family, protein-glutamate methylesterase/glutaminase
VIRVAIADDSPFTCSLLASYIEEGGECQVVGVAHDAASTVDLVRHAAPDVLTLDLQMPGGNGLDLLQQLTAAPRTAVVVISGVTRLAAATTLHALELGAVDFILKFTPGAPVSRTSLKREIVAKVKMAAAAHPTAPVRVVRPAAGEAPAPMRAPRPAASSNRHPLVVIGASTGGPRAIVDLLAQLPADFATPCVIVQHLPATFTAPFAAQLARHARLAVKEAATGDRIEPGRALVTPGAMHLALRADGRIELLPPGDQDVYRPSIDLTMTSAAEQYGASAAGVILTGMGSDGADGLKRIRDAGGDAYVQEPSSCIVASMPESALERAGADQVARPDRIGQLLAARSRS